MTQVDIAVLAKLARLEVSDTELQKLQKEIPHILGFVETIQVVAADMTIDSPAHRNVMREDVDPFESGAFTEALLENAPARVGDHVAVKQVLSRKKAS